MANVKTRHPANAAGDFFVDTTCIDCDTCRWLAPETFHDIGDQSAVRAQPAGSAQRLAAMQALVSCPTASIGVTDADTRAALREVSTSFPLPVEDDVFYCGYHAESSFGAASWFIQREGGNVMVDSPRFAAPLVKRIADMGGIRWLYLTHRDDVADHAKWAARFGAERIIHADDGRGLDAEVKLKGSAPHELAPGLTVIPVPGHTRGSTVLHYRDKFLFTGDHLAWSKRLNNLYAFRSACWYSWDEQIKSMERLLPLRFEWVLPGHGWKFRASAPEMARQLQECVNWMRRK
ncbi:MAG: MBL fold metallo-hydrolase [Planctomycetes bacterium]|nr:MBL fold metallo-hydrolase [Planctomycetota bacterium]